VVPDDRCTEEREESCGASQILTPDGAPVLGRAMGMSTRGDGARLWWLGHGREEKGRNGYGMAASVCFEKWLVARAERGKGGVGMDASASRREKEERGALAWRSTARGGQQRPPTVGRRGDVGEGG
jgi:hypothetical protein